MSAPKRKTPGCRSRGKGKNEAGGRSLSKEYPASGFAVKRQSDISPPIRELLALIQALCRSRAALAERGLSTIRISKRIDRHIARLGALEQRG